MDDGETRTTACRQPVTVEVTITVTDDVGAETPLAPVPADGCVGRRTNTPTSGDPEDIDNEPARRLARARECNGRPDLTGYEVEWKKSTETTFSRRAELPLATESPGPPELQAVVIRQRSRLRPLHDYRSRGRTPRTMCGCGRINGDGAGVGAGAWSLVGTGSTNKDGQQPASIKRTNRQHLPREL